MTKTSPEATKPVEVEAWDGELDPSERAGGTSTPGTPVYVICQSQGTNELKIKNPGKFYLKDAEGAEHLFEDLEVVILDSSPRRTRFEGESVACRSYDGCTGYDGKPCKDCKYNPFKELSDVPDNDRCKSSVVLLSVPGGDWSAEPFFVQLPASGIKDWKEYANRLQNQLHRPVYSVVTRITTTTRKGQKAGMSFVPVFTPTKGLTREETGGLGETRIAESIRFKPTVTASSGEGGETPAASGGLQDGGTLHGPVGEFQDPFAEE